MHKIMALDIGKKRIGVALSDFLHITASGTCCIERLPENQAILNIKKIAEENRVKTIVAGVPLNMDSSKGEQAKDCLEFAQKFQDEYEVIYEDERLTSEMAEENLKMKKIDFRKNKGLVDIESACIILEQYLARRK